MRVRTLACWLARLCACVHACVCAWFRFGLTVAQLLVRIGLRVLLAPRHRPEADVRNDERRVAELPHSQRSRRRARRGRRRPRRYLVTASSSVVVVMPSAGRLDDGPHRFGCAKGGGSLLTMPKLVLLMLRHRLHRHRRLKVDGAPACVRGEPCARSSTPALPDRSFEAGIRSSQRCQPKRNFELLCFS